MVITCFVVGPWQLWHGLVFFFFYPTDRLQLFQTRKKSLWLDIFFYFKFPTDRLGKIGSSLIRHSRNQPTVALIQHRRNPLALMLNVLLFKVVLEGFHRYFFRVKVKTVKGIWYGSDPVVISLQLTNFQSLIGLRMNHIVFRGDLKAAMYACPKSYKWWHSLRSWLSGHLR